jgi:hypothetical protein
MSVAWKDFLPLVLPHAPGCPEPVALGAVRLAAAEFCERTLAWRSDLDPVSVVAGRNEYSLAAPAGASVAMVLGAALDGTRLTPATEPELAEEFPFWESLEADRPGRFLLPTPGRIRLVPTPTRSWADGLVVSVALKPRFSSSQAEDFLYDDHLETLAHGARARLLAMPGRTWSGTELSLHYDRQFRAGLTDARGRFLKGGTSASLTARYRAFV